jgi:hypothetical protein
MTKLSIKRIKRLVDGECPKAIARYLRVFISPEKRSALEVKLDEYAHFLLEHAVEKKDIEKKLVELEGSVVGPPKV